MSRRASARAFLDSSTDLDGATAGTLTPVSLDEFVALDVVEAGLDIAIHEAVLAAKEKRAPETGRRKVKSGTGKAKKAELTIDLILHWADLHHGRTEDWPKKTTGAVVDAPGLSWSVVNGALRGGLRGLPGGNTLARLLAESRGAFNLHGDRPLSVEVILCWADAHFQTTGKWPNQASGPVSGEAVQTWVAINASLRTGRRGLPGGSSLARLLSECRGAYNSKSRPNLRVRSILTWMDNFHASHGCFPNASSGAIRGQKHETWGRVESALREGLRGLPGGLSLSRLLYEHRGVKHRYVDNGLTEEQIVAWADSHCQRSGKWPEVLSGAISDAPGETWLAINSALSDGLRGLAGGSSLARLLAERRGKYNRKGRPRFSEELILEWADQYYAAHGVWPNRHSGPIDGQPYETWGRVNTALFEGLRGLTRKTTLRRLLEERRGAVFGVGR